MILKFLIQEEGEEPKILEFKGKYTIKDLEEIYLQLIDTSESSEWFRFKSKPNGMIIRKRNVKSVYLEGQDDEKGN